MKTIITTGISATKPENTTYTGYSHLTGDKLHVQALHAANIHFAATTTLFVSEMVFSEFPDGIPIGKGKKGGPPPRYHCAEQYLQASKAELFGGTPGTRKANAAIADQIRALPVDGNLVPKCITLGKTVKDFNDTVWRDSAPKLFVEFFSALYAENARHEPQPIDLYGIMSQLKNTLLIYPTYNIPWGILAYDTDGNLYLPLDDLDTDSVLNLDRYTPDQSNLFGQALIAWIEEVVDDEDAVAVLPPVPVPAPVPAGSKSSRPWMPMTLAAAPKKPVAPVKAAAVAMDLDLDAEEEEEDDNPFLPPKAKGAPKAITKPQPQPKAKAPSTPPQPPKPILQGTLFLPSEKLCNDLIKVTIGQVPTILEVTVKKAPSTTGRDPVFVVCCLDRSYSMREAIPALKSSLCTFIDHLDVGDGIAVILFSSDTRMLIEPTEITHVNQKLALKQAVDGLFPSGGTNYDIAFAQMGRIMGALDPKWIGHTVGAWMTDGYPNEGDGAKQAKRAVWYSECFTEALGDQSPIRPTVNFIGFGTNYYQDMLAELAANHDGSCWHYTEDDKDAGMEHILIAIFESQAKTLATNLSLKHQPKAFTTPEYSTAKAISATEMTLPPVEEGLSSSSIVFIDAGRDYTLMCKTLQLTSATLQAFAATTQIQGTIATAINDDVIIRDVFIRMAANIAKEWQEANKPDDPMANKKIAHLLKLLEQHQAGLSPSIYELTQNKLLNSQLVTKAIIKDVQVKMKVLNKLEGQVKSRGQGMKLKGKSVSDNKRYDD